MPIIALIVAAGRNGVIGRAGGMPWHIPSDLKTFRRLTMGKPVVMGRRTFQSIGKPLDGRDNIVVTRQAGFAPAGVAVAGSLGDALALARRSAEARGTDEIMVIGGADIYAQALALAGRVYLTEVQGEPEGDATFPPLDPAVWREVHREPLVRGPRDDYDCILRVLERSRPGAPPR